MLPTCPFSNLVWLPSPTPSCLSHLTFTPAALFVVLLYCLSGWLIMVHLMYYFTEWYYESAHVRPWYLSTRRTLACVLCTKVSCFRKVWHITWFFAGCWYSNLILQTHTHTRTHTTHTLAGANRLTHPYEYILTPPVASSQQLSLLKWMNKRCNETIFFLWNTNTNINDVNKKER